MSAGLPAITGPELINLLKKDGWEERGNRATHGISLTKTLPNGRTLTTIIPTKSRSLPIGTLKAILSSKQTGLGREGLQELLNRD
ncbi:type II toxin-antitoxin system HicA family toxin [candidate division KSB1 bacterium]|nr:type II toxin-antitoxin system HicA family toxin [candidate division KSB1 bacterium]